MGMDVYGKHPSSKTGEYFRNNVWFWRPLWRYCESVAPVCKKVKYGQKNAGDGLGARDSLTLALTLQDEIESGRTAEYAERYKASIESLPEVECRICRGTGKRAEPPEVGTGEMLCNGCGGKGTRHHFDSYYPFTVENVSNFAAFLRDSGGFEID